MICSICDPPSHKTARQYKYGVPFSALPPTCFSWTGDVLPAYDHRELKCQDFSTKVENCVSFSSFMWRSFTSLTSLLKPPDTLCGHKASSFWMETSFQLHEPGAPWHRNLCQCQQFSRVTALTLTWGSSWARAPSQKDTAPWQALTPPFGKKWPEKRDGFLGAMGRPPVCPDRPHRSLCWFYISIRTSKVSQVNYGEGGKEN